MPARQPSPKSDSSAGTVVIASASVMFVGMVMAFAYILFGPFFLFGIVLLCGFAAFGTLHWWLWGRSMGGQTDNDDAPSP